MSCAILLTLICCSLPVLAQHRGLHEPVTLASKDGVLEVRLTARQGQAMPRYRGDAGQNMLVFGYELIRGTRFQRADVGQTIYILRRRCRCFPARR